MQNYSYAATPTPSSSRLHMSVIPGDTGEIAQLQPCLEIATHASDLIHTPELTRQSTGGVPGFDLITGQLDMATSLPAPCLIRADTCYPQLDNPASQSGWEPTTHPSLSHTLIRAQSDPQSFCKSREREDSPVESQQVLYDHDQHQLPETDPVPRRTSLISPSFSPPPDTQSPSTPYSTNLPPFATPPLAVSQPKPANPQNNTQHTPLTPQSQIGAVKQNNNEQEHEKETERAFAVKDRGVGRSTAQTSPFKCKTGAQPVGPIMQLIQGEDSPRREKRLWKEVSQSEIEEDVCLGVGGTARVVKARWGRKTVAVKYFYKQVIESELFLMLDLECPHLVRLYGACTQTTPPFLVMEYMKGGSLADHIKTPMPMGLVIELALDIVHGLCYLHDKKIMHRDIKPGNILLTKQPSNQNHRSQRPNAKLCDFGVSRYLTSSETTRDVGTDGYMAPEVRVSNTYDLKVDIYSLGMVLFVMLTRRTPFELLAPCEKSQMIMMGGRETISEEERLRCPKLAELINRCWAHDPYARPTCYEVLSKLEEIAPSCLSD